MYEPGGICPGVGIVAGGVRLAVGSHGAVCAGGAGWTTWAPLGMTTTAFTVPGVLGDAEPQVPRTTDATTAQTAAAVHGRRIRTPSDCGRAPITGTPQCEAGNR